MRGIERCRTTHATPHDTRRRGAVEDGVTYNFSISNIHFHRHPPVAHRANAREGAEIPGVETCKTPARRGAAGGGVNFLRSSVRAQRVARVAIDTTEERNTRTTVRNDNSYNAAAIDVHRAALSIGRLCAGFHRAQDVLHNGTRPEEVEGKARVAAGYNAV